MRLSPLIFLPLFTLLSMAASADAERGKLLYQNHCTSCHESTIHIRAKKLVESPKDLLYQVNRWQNNLGLGWGEQDINDVSTHLNHSYYRFNSTK